MGRLIRAACTTIVALTLLVVPVWSRQVSAQADPPTTGLAVESLAAYDRAMLDLMAKWSLPGGALAVVKGDRLVLARGYGFADREADRPVQPDSLFRIASLSKPITATAILQLVEQGRLGPERSWRSAVPPAQLGGREGRWCAGAGLLRNRYSVRVHRAARLRPGHPVRLLESRLLHPGPADRAGDRPAVRRVRRGQRARPGRGRSHAARQHARRARGRRSLVLRSRTTTILARRW